MAAAQREGGMGNQRRGMQRAAIHLMRAAIEVVEGLSAFLEELQKVDGDHDAAGGSTGIERIPLDGEE